MHTCFSIDNQLRSLNPTRPINREDAQRSRTLRDRKRKFANLEPLPLPLSITESLTKHNPNFSTDCGFD